MKPKIYPIVLFLFLALCSSAQTGSVALKNASNVQLSTHSSISDAYANIPSTITSGYIIEIGSSYDGASETYPITFTANAGASSVNTITIRPASTVTAVTIQTNIAVAGGGVMKFDDADYYVIDGRPGGTGTVGVLSFSNSSTAANGNTMSFINGSCFNVVRYCNLYNSTTSATGRCVLLSTSASNVSGNSDNTFFCCNFSGGRYQFNSNGTAANSNTRNLMKGCNFSNSTFAGFWGQAGTAKVVIDSCNFFCTTPTGSGLYFGIVFDSQKDSAVIKNNRFYDIQDASTGVLRYIHVRSIAASSTNFTEIRNNFFSMTTGNTSLVDVGFIELEGTAGKARVVHNSFRMAGTQTPAGTSGNVCSSALHISSTNSLSAYEVTNNLFVNERTGGTGVHHVGVNISSTVPAVSIDYNTYNSTSGSLVRYGTTAYTSLSAYQAVVPGGEPNANTTPVQYVAANNLHLSCNTSFTNTSLLAPLVPGITTDIDNQTRGGSTVFRGADEIFGLAPTVTVNSGTICSGDSFTLTVSGTATSYAWSTGATVISPTVTTTYSATGTSTNGCQEVDSGTLTVNQAPTVTINSGTICAGTSFTLNASGATSFTYSSASGTVTNIVTPTSNETYTVTGVDANNCVNTAVSSVAVNASPTLSVNDGTICVGESFTIIPNGAVNYTYSSGTTVVNPTSNTNYTITGADAANCISTIVSSVTVNQLPNITVTDGSICIGDSYTIVPNGAVNYTFSGGSDIVTPTANTNYTVTGEDANGCLNTVTVDVTVNPLPVVTATGGAICAGSSFTIEPAGALTYTYSSGSDVVNPSVNTVYTVTGTDSNGCSSTTQLTVNVNPLPSVSISGIGAPICVNSKTISLTGLPGGGTFSGPGLSGNIFTPTNVGTFTVSYAFTDINGCTDTAYANVIVDQCTGIPTGDVITGLSVFPNPNNGSFNIELGNELEKTIRITDISGKHLYEMTTSEDNIHISMNDLAKGIYYLSVVSGTQRSVIKVVKE